jgi:RHS repeat-associated protein
LTTLTRYSDLAGTTTVLISAYTYDKANRVTGISDKTSGGTVRVSYSYTLDNANRVTQEVRNWASGASTDTVTYGYTNNNQLTSVTHTNGSFSNETFSYDTNGNRNSSGYGTGTDNRISTDGTYNYAFDNEGNLTTRTKISDSSQTIYKWDYHNRLTEVDSKPFGGATVVLATYTYDALDRRIGRTEGGTTTATLYDGNAPVLDFVNGSGTPSARYLQGLGAVVDQVLAREKSGTVAWYLPDRLGTIRDIVDNTGAIIDHVDYSAYGKVLSETVPSVGDRLTGFAGLERDTATGLNLAIYRVQDPATGRWDSQDPWGFTAGDSNLFVYAFNEPTILTDSTGEDVYIEETAAAGRLHRRITVDVLGSGPLSVGFGPAPGQGPFNNPLTGPPNGPAPGRPGNGIVSPDRDPPTKVVCTMKTTPAEDVIIQKYLKSLVGQRGGYNVTGWNCRTFAEREFDFTKRWLERRRKRLTPSPALPR